MIKSVFVAVALFAGSTAYAQTCTNPIEVFSDNAGGHFAPPGSTTCGAADAIGVFPGGIASPQPDIVYFFDAQSASATITMTADADLVPGLLIMDACDDTADIMAVADGQPGDTLTITANGLTDGDRYYLIVTSSPVAADDNCGGFTGNIEGQLPVSLQNVTVD